MTMAPLRPATGRWFNKRRIVKDGHDGQLTEKWVKVLAHTGRLTQFGYGTDTLAEFMPSAAAIADYPVCIPQVCLILTFGTRAFVVDVDYEQEFGTTRTARLIGREQAMSIRGDRYHVMVDARGVPQSHWPRKVPIAGADIISNLFVPVPGSIHYSGALYEPTALRPPWVRCTPELLAAIRADQAGHKGSVGGSRGQGGHGGGHDGEVAAHVLGWLRTAVNAGRDPADPALREEIYQRWLKVAVPKDPSYPFERADFENRHYRTAVQTIAEDPGMVLPPGALEWSLAQLPSQGRPARRRNR